MRAAEQLANVRIRLGSQTVERAQKERDQAAARLKTAGRGRRAADRKARADAKRAVNAAERALRKSLVSARAEIKNGIALLEKLDELHPTMERESLRGSAYKRLALIAAAAGQAAEERRAIEATRRHYARAVAIGERARRRMSSTRGSTTSRRSWR